jgi:hypothetical protein
MKKCNRNIEKLDLNEFKNHRYFYYFFDIDDDDGYYYDCDSYYHEIYYPDVYYKDDIYLERVIRFRGLPQESKILYSKLIDLNSIYSKSVRRDKLIDELFSSDSNDYSNTIYNIIKSKE